MDACMVCGSNHHLGGSVDLGLIVCMDCSEEFNAWADANRDALYSAWPALTA